MTLVLYSATLTDVSDRVTRLLGDVGARTNTFASLDQNPDSAPTWTNQLGNRIFAYQRPFLFDQSTWDRLRGDVAGVLYQKPLSIPVRRAPRRILFQDDFEAAALKWNQASGTLTRTTTAGEFWDGVAAMKFVTGAAAGNACQATKPWGYQGLQKYVVECWWTWSAAAATTPRSFDMQLTLGDGTNNHFMRVRYLKNLSGAQNKWQFEASVGSFTDITGGAETLPVDAADPVTWHYFRAHFNMSAATPNLDELHTDTLDLTGLTAAGFTAGTSTIADQLAPQFTTDAAAATTGFVDDLVVSDSEA